MSEESHIRFKEGVIILNNIFVNFYNFQFKQITRRCLSFLKQRLKMGLKPVKFMILQMRYNFIINDANILALNSSMNYYDAEIIKSLFKN